MPFVMHLRSATEKDLPSGKDADCRKYKISIKIEKIVQQMSIQILHKWEVFVCVFIYFEDWRTMNRHIYVSSNIEHKYVWI